MRRFSAALVLVLTAGLLVAAAPAAHADYHSRGTSMGKWGTLRPLDALVSPNGRYRAVLQANGRFVVRDDAHILWGTSAYGADARVFLHADGNVTVKSGTRQLWSSGTSGAGASARLVMRDTGALAVTRPAGTAWSSRFGNGCRSFTSGRKVFVDLSGQYLWLCDAGQQQLTALVTTGAVDVGNGTPTGTWHVQGHERDRYLYPAAGGAYFVHYWLPYDYDYGLHDSSWQRFPYGSQRYRTEGSHGCTHVPAQAMRFVYYWAWTGTQVTIRA